MLIGAALIHSFKYTTDIFTVLQLTGREEERKKHQHISVFGDHAALFNWPISKKVLLKSCDWLISNGC